jgi:hypothetical protein
MYVYFDVMVGDKVFQMTKASLKAQWSQEVSALMLDVFCLIL